MIRPIGSGWRRRCRRRRWLARRRWKRVWVPIAILRIEGLGRMLVAHHRLETRWSDRHARRLWRLPAAPAAAPPPAGP
jgi:hypothetical protein